MGLYGVEVGTSAAGVGTSGVVVGSINVLVGCGVVVGINCVGAGSSDGSSNGVLLTT